MKTCFIIGACEESQIDFNYSKDDLIIAADAGYKFLKDRDYPIDIIIGDFDSLGYAPAFDNIITLPTIKDITDTHRAIEEAIAKGYSNIVLIGCIGGRFDHSIATIQDMKKVVEMGYNCEAICSKVQKMKIIHNDTFSFEKESGFISVFAYGMAKKVTIKGLKYEVEKINLFDNFPLGVSNEFINKKATISVEDGYLIIIY